MKEEKGFALGVPHFDISHGNAAFQFHIMFEIDPIPLRNLAELSFQTAVFIKIGCGIHTGRLYGSGVLFRNGIIGGRSNLRCFGAIKEIKDLFGNHFGIFPMEVVAVTCMADVFDAVTVSFNEIITDAFTHEIVFFTVNDHRGNVLQILRFGQTAADAAPCFQRQPGGFVFRHGDKIFIHGGIVIIPPIHVIVKTFVFAGNRQRGKGIFKISLIPLIGRGIAAYGRGGFKNDTADSFGIIQSNKLSNMGAAGMTHQVDPIQSHGVEEADHIVAEETFFNTGNAAGFSIAVGAHFGDIDMIIGKVRSDQRPGTAGIGSAVNQNERFAVTVAHFHIIHFDPAGDLYRLFMVGPVVLRNSDGKGRILPGVNRIEKNLSRFGTCGVAAGIQAIFVIAFEHAGLIGIGHTVHGVFGDLADIVKFGDVFVFIGGQSQIIADAIGFIDQFRHILTENRRVRREFCFADTFDDPLSI